MTYEILLPDKCSQLVSRLELPDLCTHANRLHSLASADGCPWTPITIVRAFSLYRPDGVEGGGFGCVLFAFAGTGCDETDGYEGFEVAFGPGELTEACALLAKHAAQYDEQFIADELAGRIRASGE